MNSIQMITAARMVDEHKAELNDPIYNTDARCKAYNERCISELTEKLNAFNPNWKFEYADFKASC